MKTAGALVGVVITLGIVYFLYRAELTSGPGRENAPQQQIEAAGVTADLLSIGQAEQVYLVNHGSYGSVDELRADGDIAFSGSNRRGYNFSAELDGGQHFKITATPAGQSGTASSSLSIDETMEVKKL